MTVMDDSLGHLSLVRHFEEAFDQTQDERADAERDRDYYDNKQLTAEEEEALRKRGQPIVIDNRIGPKVDALQGHLERMRSDPKAYPRTPKHEQEAESITDALRFVCDKSQFSEIESEAADNLLVEGIEAATVTVKMVGEEPDIRITHVPWDRFYRDPHSRKRDFSDAQYMGVVLWMDEDEALEQFNGKDAIISACYTSSEEAGTYDDRPAVSWSDRSRKRIRVLQHRFKHKGRWHTAIVCKGGFLRDPQVSPYEDEDGTPQCDLIATSAYVDRENRRYGVARRHISPQDEINKRKSKALHLLNSRQIIAEDGAVLDMAQAKRELAKPDGIVVVTPGMRFEPVDQQGLVMGQFQLLQEAKASIDSSGVNPAIEGDASAPSGRAQEMLLQNGLAEMSKVFKAHKSWRLAIYRQVWYRVRQYWTSEKWIRVTDDEKNMRWVALNKPVTRGEQMLEQMRQEAEQGGQPLPPDIEQQIMADPMMQQQVAVKNSVSELDVDVILDEGPDSITIQSEQYQGLIELKKSDPAAIPTRLIIEASSLRNKDKLFEHLDKGGVPPELQQQMQEMQKALQEAEQKLQSAQGSNELKDRELRIKQYEAVTARISALGAIPPDVPDDWQGDASTPQVADGAMA